MSELRPKRNLRAGLFMLGLLIASYLAANYALTRSFTKGSALFLPFFLAIVISNWFFMPAGPAIHLSRQGLRFEGWGLLIRPKQMSWRDVDAFGIEPGNLWLTRRDKICWRLRAGHPNHRGDLAVRLPSEPPPWDGKVDNIYGESAQVLRELERWRAAG
jgi:hypothetical protein